MRYLRYGIFGGLGLLLLVGGPIAFSYGLYELMETGTCASGGPYVSARECPDGTGENVALLMGGIFGTLLGPVVFAGRGTLVEGGRKKITFITTAIWMWAALFIGGGAAALYSALGPEADFEGGKGTGIFLGALFIPMGLVPVIGAILARSSGRYRGKPVNPLPRPQAATSRPVTVPPTYTPPPAPAPPAYTPPTPPGPPAAAAPNGGDAVERLRRLGELHKTGVLSAAEFEAAKARILSDL